VLFIPDPDPDYLPIPDPGRHRIPDLDPQHWYRDQVSGSDLTFFSNKKVIFFTTSFLKNIIIVLMVAD
jgi:hypothetical protein